MNLAENTTVLDISKYANYNLGLPIIDAQHQVFFMLLDELSALNRHSVNKKEIAFVLDRLHDYVFYHFDEEEHLMENFDVVGRELHQQQHQTFRERMDAFQIAYDYKNPILLHQMLEFMRKWLVVHIMGLDRVAVEAILQKLHTNISL